MDGFYGRILFIDLTAETWRINPLDKTVAETGLGGKALATRLLLTHNPPGIDPLDPENRLIFATGPATGSRIWGSCRYGVYTKSPQTGIFSESYAGGKVPEAMDAAGFDAVVVCGKSRAPVVLAITPEGAAFHPAEDLWGMDTYDAEAEAVKRFAPAGTRRKGAVVIGPAGEAGVCFAVIENDRWRSAGRSGTGTVMGAKNIKAVVFAGDRRRTVHDPGALAAFSRRIMADNRAHAGVISYRTKGTAAMVEVANTHHAFPTRYWSQGHYDRWASIGAAALHERCDVTPQACGKCFIACGRLSTLKHGRHAGLTIEGPEYETIFAFGGLCCIDSIEEIAHLNDLCDRLGMDTITAGNLCAFAIEARRRGRMDFNIDYGQVDAIADLLGLIAAREGVGDVLARGIRHAAAVWDLEDLAIHVKGMEPPGYDPRALKGMGLAYATSGRGACHMRATILRAELTGQIAPGETEGKADVFMDFEDRHLLFDALILCRFYRDLYPWEEISEIFRIITGHVWEKNELQEKAAAMADDVRRFNLREGMDPAEDRLPVRFHREPLTTGESISEEELSSMRADYYRLRAWDATGRPSAP